MINCKTKNFKALLSALLMSAVFSLFLVALGQQSKVTGSTAPEPELAKYMTELQTLTHKLALAIKHNNPKLAEFYMYESMLLMEDTKKDVPEYKELPIAVLIEQIAEPQYKKLKNTLKKEKELPKLVESKGVMSQLIQSCNECHHATQHEFIKITLGDSSNPFNQDFSHTP